MSTQRRVFVTGIGVVSPLGSDRESFWQALQRGESALQWLSIPPDEERLWSGPAAGARAVIARDLRPILLEARRGDLGPLLNEPTIELALLAALEAVSDAKPGCDPERLGCVIGTSKGGMHSLLKLSAGESASDWWALTAPNGPACAVASLMNAQGAVLAPVTACATGLSCLVRGVELIQSGQCDVVLAGSADASLNPAVQASFRRLGVLARGFEDPQHAVKPFDRERSGFLAGEGSAIFVLEAEDQPNQPESRAYAEWLCGGAASDAAGLTQLNDQPDALVWLIRDVLRRSKLKAADIDLVGLHGTATRMNDAVEARALIESFGPHAERVAASAIKGAIGHLLGAAGSVEFAALLLSLRDQIQPPVAGLNERDPECPLNLVQSSAVPRSMEHALKLSLGFGGHLVAAIIRRMDRSGR